MNGRPSPAAVLAASRVTVYGMQALDAAHDPALGLDRSVCLRDVVQLVMERYPAGGEAHRAVVDVVRRFGPNPGL